MKRIFTLIALLLFASPAWGAPSCSSAGTVTSDLGSSPTLTISVNVSSTNSYLAILFAWRSHTVGVTSVVRDGQTFSNVATKANTTDNISTALYSFVNPTTGTANAVVTLASTFSGAGAAGAILCTGVNAVTPENTPGSAESASASNLDVSLTSDTGELAIGGAAVNDSSVQPPSTGFADGTTSLFDLASSVGTGFDVALSGGYKAGAVGVAVNFQGSSGPWAGVGVSLKPATSTRRPIAPIIFQ